MRKVRFFVQLSVLVIFFSGFQSHRKIVPIWFEEYDVEIFEIRHAGDTLRYNKSSEEDFKFVFYSSSGKCYCERYIKGKLYERGHFANSLDTLKRYVSGRSSHGKNGPIKVQEYFQPLKDGDWFIYKDKIIKESYRLGILVNN